MARRRTVDGVQVWQFDVPRGFKIEAPNNMDFTKDALHIVADQLRPADRFSLIAFAEDALLMVPSTRGTEPIALRQAVDRLDQIDLGDETYMARGMAMAHKQILEGTRRGMVDRMIVLTDGYTKEPEACRSLASQARQNGVVITTMGLGLDFNEELMIDLAEQSGGHAYFAEDPADIPAAFAEELAGAQSITWRELSLSLTMPTEITLRRVHRVSPTIAHIAANPDAIPLGDLEIHAPPAALLELVVPPRPAGTYRLAQVTLHARPASGGARQHVAQEDVVVHYSERPSEAKQTDPELMAVIRKVSAFKLQSQAIEEAAQGNIAGATHRLRAGGERLIEMGEEDLGQTMLDEAEHMEERGEMSSEGTKRLRYGTRKLR
jgi:Ca-activated chloride channel family protein